LDLHPEGPSGELDGLLLSAKHGDQVALRAFIHRTQREVWRLSAHVVGSDHADGITQEVYLRLHRSLVAYRRDVCARTWLLAIACNACADKTRRLGKRRRTRKAHGIPAGRPDERLAFALTQQLRLSYQQAAGVCGCPVTSIRSRVAAARTALLKDRSAAAREASQPAITPEGESPCTPRHR
jgi:RNA polymerase sigma-70 factor (ECF subfamily)